MCGLLIGLLVWRANRRSGGGSGRSMPESSGESRMSPMGGSIQSPSGVPLVDSAALDTVDRQCGKCNTWLTGMVVEAEGVFWHLRCFTCDLCTKPLKVGALERVGEHVYCSSCAAEHSARPAASSLKRGSNKSRALAGSEIYVDEDPVVIVDGTSESDSPADIADSTARRSNALSTDSRASKTKGKRPSGGAKVRDAEATARAKARAAAAREAARERHEEKVRERQKRDKAKQKQQQQQRAKRAPERQSDSDSEQAGDSGRNSDVRFSGVFAALDNEGEGSDSDKITLGPKASTQAMPSSPSPVASRKY